MDLKLKKLYQIEPDTKTEKLLEELIEQVQAINNYIQDPNYDNMYQALLEWIDTGIVLGQLALVKHDFYTAEILSMAREKVHKSIMLLERMKSESRTYEDVRREYERY